MADHEVVAIRAALHSSLSSCFPSSSPVARAGLAQRCRSRTAGARARSDPRTARAPADRAAGHYSHQGHVRDQMDPTMPRDNASSWNFARRNDNAGKWQGIPPNK